MKKFLYFIFAALLVSCTEQKTSSEKEPESLGTEVYEYFDSCQHLVVRMALELPLDNDTASMAERFSLIRDFEESVRNLGLNGDSEYTFPSYSGDLSDGQALVDFYGKNVYAFLLQQAKEDYSDRLNYVKNDSSYTAEERQSILDDVPLWEYELKVKKSVDADKFVVYRSEVYAYFGGAHGGVSGMGDLTFNKATGKKITDMLQSTATVAIQPLLRSGLIEYFSWDGDLITNQELDERLMLMDDTIPQPAWTPCPNATGDSLIFTYQQYEIACYADGMPSFRVPVSNLLPYLTPQAKAILTADM